MKRLPIAFFLLCNAMLVSAQTVVNGIPWYDQNREPVSAHGANIIKDGSRYYLFGEYKTDSANVFTGFSCYSSSDLAQWRFEGMALAPKAPTSSPEGDTIDPSAKTKEASSGAVREAALRLGPDRVGERPKVLRCPKTGE